MRAPGLLLLAALALAAGPVPADEPPRPNIVYFLIDDMGWNDVGYHGSEIRTPNIDRLAAEGVRLEQFYALPVCTPTRAALLTGRYPIRHGLQSGVIFPTSDYGLPLDERTLPAALKEVGYRTAMAGKWHLGHCEEAYQPQRRGFDTAYGCFGGEIDYYEHTGRKSGADWYRDGKPVSEEGYSTDLLTREAIRVVEQHDPSEPLFLYVPFNATHSPLAVEEKWLEPYSGIQNRDRKLKAGVTACVDAAIGRILAALEKRGMSGNTLILFSSDNGGPEGRDGGGRGGGAQPTGGGADNGPLRGGKATLYEGGVRVPAVAVWKGKLAPGTVVNEVLHMVDWYPTILELAGAPLAQPLPLDGRDIWPVLAEGEPTPHEELLLNVESKGGALRRGDWKIVVRGSVRGENLEVELFNLAKDPGESTDLSQQEPEKVEELLGRLRWWQEQSVPPKNQGANGKGPGRRNGR